MKTLLEKLVTYIKVLVLLVTFFILLDLLLEIVAHLG